MSIKYNDKRVFLVSENDKEKLEKAGINFVSLDGNYYVVSQGKKPKKFTDNEIREIKKDLDSGMSLKDAEKKYRCSKNTIIKIKRGNY
ncbi:MULTISPECIES: helix-turn-helix domain containing protein [unclassified Clostridioides]|uniref:helix-turn-helix domain containing protein n=1 Tax=unclassified Clostridioides TaxID=2635829 RepID=UPI001D10E9BF|nr:helix-turn-helix domain containing protein [Clostridioides sp. ZZV14-6048]MCC0739880.1 helix-turn-helix domain containing protein [Clostridioides sp. ZZV14-5902]